MKIKLFSRRGIRGRRWYFRIVAVNGEPVAQSEGYHNRQDALSTIRLLRVGMPQAELVE